MVLFQILLVLSFYHGFSHFFYIIEKLVNEEIKLVNSMTRKEEKTLQKIAKLLLNVSINERTCCFISVSIKFDFKHRLCIYHFLFNKFCLPRLSFILVFI